MKTPRQTPPNVNDRNARLKAALQANIARRKTQIRVRADPAAAGPEAEDTEPENEPENDSENGPEPEQRKE